MAYGHRLPCGGVIDELPIRGSCGQHYDSSENGLIVYENTTKVKDHHIPPDNAGITPYKRPCTAVRPTCAEETITCCSETDPSPCCDLPDPEADFISSPTITSGAYPNTFIATESTMDLAKCNKIGFKNCFYFKNYHGVWAYNSRDWLAPDNFNFWGDCEYHSDDTNTPSDAIKYLTISVNTEFKATYKIDGETVIDNLILVAESSVGRYTGVKAATYGVDLSSFDGDNRFGDESTITTQLRNSLILANSNIYKIYDIYRGWVIYVGNNDPGLGDPTTAVSTGNGNWRVAWEQNYGTEEDPDFREVYVISVDMTAGEVIKQNYGLAGIYPDYIFKLLQEEKYTCTATEFTYTYVDEERVPEDPDYYKIERTVTCTLSNPYTGADIMEDLEALRDVASDYLADDILYPFRTDTNVNAGPIICYDETNPNAPYIPDLGLVPDITYYDTVNPNLFTGDIVGVPHEYHGAPFWDPKFENWEYCVDINNNKYWYIDSYGGWSTDITGVPASATKWTNIKQQEQYPQYPSIRYTEPVLYANDYIEARVQKPSINFARPCGWDRFAPDMTTAHCIKEIVDNTVTLEDVGYEPTTLVTGDKVFVCTTGNSAIYEITKTGDYTITLTTLLVPSSRLTPEYINNCGTGLVCKIRWGLATPGLCGDARIAEITSNGTDPVLVKFRKQHYLLDGDLIEFNNCNGFPEVTGHKYVTVVDNYSVTLNGVTAPSTRIYTGGGFAIAGGAPERWNDSGSKGDFTIKRWETNYRDIGEHIRLEAVNNRLEEQTNCDAFEYPDNPRPYQSSHGLPQEVTSVECTTMCLPLNHCCPAIIGTRKYKEITGLLCNENIYPMYDAFTIDKLYGSYRAIEIEQQIKDPFWQAPPCPCGEVEDSPNYFAPDECYEDPEGICKEDYYDEELDKWTRYYAHAPMVEARCERPTDSDLVTAPALPSGIYIGCLPQEEVDISSTPQGNVCSYPPLGVGIHYPWLLFLNEYDCVCDGRRFNQDYIRNRVICEEVDI